MRYADIDRALAGTGMAARGGFRPRPDDGVPGAPEAAVLIGNVGGAMWDAFAAAVPEAARTSDVHPLDTWTRHTLAPVADALGATALFPFDGPPFRPFLRWAMRAEPVHPSPIGPLIHPEWGLWHAYRAAFAFAEPIDLPKRTDIPSPCDTCVDRPCLAGCPVDAIRRDAYDVPACVDHVTSEAGDDCFGGGCRARRACPVGREHVYGPAQQAFHMAKFVAGQRRP